MSFQMVMSKKMFDKNEFFLQNFFEEQERRPKNINLKLSVKKMEEYKKEMDENIKRMGDFELKNFTILTHKEIYEEYQKNWQTKGTVKECHSKDLRNCLQILFYNSNEKGQTSIYDNAEQLDDFLNTLIQKNKQVLLKRLFGDLLVYYPADKLFFERLAKIYKSLDKQKKSHQSIIEANDKFSLTEQTAPFNIAQNILDIDINKSLSSVLARIWLKEEHLISGGIGKTIVEELCTLMKKKVVVKKLSIRTEHDVQTEDELILERFLEYLSGQNEIRFTQCKKLVAEVLLRPFENQISDLKARIQQKITEFLDKCIGDPRFESEKWINMDREKAIFLKWKIGETLKDFFELLSYTSRKDPDADRMWQHREEFIKAYWKAGHIREAWIVLGKEAYKKRNKFLKKDNTSYGQIPKGANPVHSVLLFQIGDLVLSEWNYNGKVRLWDSYNKKAPLFYKKAYSRDELIEYPKKEIIHASNDRYYWQNELSQYIQDYTGIPCPESLQRKIDKYQR